MTNIDFTAIIKRFGTRMPNGGMGGKDKDQWSELLMKQSVKDIVPTAQIQ